MHIRISARQFVVWHLEVILQRHRFVALHNDGIVITLLGLVSFVSGAEVAFLGFLLGELRFVPVLFVLWLLFVQAVGFVVS